MKKKRVIVNGAQGKMGLLASTTLTHHEEFDLVAGLGRNDNLAEMIRITKADIVVDLTRADCAYENTKTIIEAQAYPVIGTSGLLETDVQRLKKMCEAHDLGGIIVPNFSIGAVLMMQFAAKAAHYLSAVEIIEAHHPQKHDAPSGSAIKTAEMIAEARKNVWQRPDYKEILPGALGASYRDIPIHSLRLPGVLAEQDVIFGHEGATLTISHKTLDRSAYMPGLVLSCQRVMSLKTLYYGLESLLEGGSA